MGIVDIFFWFCSTFLMAYDAQSNSDCMSIILRFERCELIQLCCVYLEKMFSCEEPMLDVSSMYFPENFSFRCCYASHNGIDKFLTVLTYAKLSIERAQRELRLPNRALTFNFIIIFGTSFHLVDGTL